MIRIAITAALVALSGSSARARDFNGNVHCEVERGKDLGLYDFALKSPATDDKPVWTYEQQPEPGKQLPQDLHVIWVGALTKSGDFTLSSVDTGFRLVVENIVDFDNATRGMATLFTGEVAIAIGRCVWAHALVPRE
jgi:hypothetical protein